MAITELFLYKILFTLEIFVAMTMYCISQKKRKLFLLRLIISFILCIIVSVLFPLFYEISYSWWYTSIMFIFLFFLCGTSMYFTYDISLQKIFFISIIAYTIQHISYELFSVISITLNLSDVISLSIYGSEQITWNAIQMLPFVTCFVCYLVVYTLSYILLNKSFKVDEFKTNSLSIICISALILFSEVVLNSIIVYSNLEIDDLVMLIIIMYNLVCCLMILYIVFTVLKNKKMELELIATSQLLHKSEERFHESKKNVDLINLKCHDLKHQIRKYGESGNLSQNVIDDISKMIKIYDAEVQTDNEILDLILSEKSLLCQKQNINLKCFADCSKLDFVSESDLYSLFGNAIDNAIEAVNKIKEVKKRNINIVVRNKMNFVSIVIDNYYEGTINLDDDGFPITTKANSNYHGFGLKSIRMIVNKYNGSIKVLLNKDIFSLIILLPIDNQI